MVWRFTEHRGESHEAVLVATMDGLFLLEERLTGEWFLQRQEDVRAVRWTGKWVTTA